MDLGACPKSHTERLKTEFLAAREANPTDPIFTRHTNDSTHSYRDECPPP